MFITSGSYTYGMSHAEDTGVRGAKIDLFMDTYDAVSYTHLAAPLPGRFIASAVLDALWARCEALLTDYHAKNPLHAGIRAAELRQKMCIRDSGGRRERELRVRRGDALPHL